MKRALWLILLAVSSASLALAASEEWELSWSEIGAVISGRKISVDLPDGEKVRGNALVVEDDGLRMAVKRSSNRKKHPKGVTVIPRASISEMRLIETGSKWKVIGAVAGVGGGLFLAGLVAYYVGPAGFFGVWGATGAVCIAAGFSADRRVTLIKVTDEHH